MTDSRLTRRAFAATLAAAPLAGAEAPWINLFDGRTLQGWRPSENTQSWSVRDGVIFCDGPRSHLFYDGPVNRADFRNMFRSWAKTLVKGMDDLKGRTPPASPSNVEAKAAG